MLSMLLRLPPIAYFIAAPLILAFAVFMFLGTRDEEAAKAAALAGQPPAAVAIEAFDPAKNVGPAGEVVVVGQVDMANMIEMRRMKDGEEKGRRVFAAIHPATATDAKAPALAVFAQDGPISDAQLQAMMIGRGPIGPVMRIPGKALAESDARKDASDALDGKVQLVAAPLYIDPFEAGRAAGLAPSETGQLGSFVVFGIGLAVAGFGYYRWRRLMGGGSRERARA